MLNDKKLISEKIKNARLRSGLTQEQFAEKVGITSQQVSRIECGNFLPLLPTFFNIAQVLNLKLEDFITPDKKEKENKLFNKLMQIINNLSDTELECCYNVIQSQIKNFELLKNSKTKKHA